MVGDAIGKQFKENLFTRGYSVRILILISMTFFKEFCL